MNFLEKLADEAKKKVQQVQRSGSAVVAQVNPVDNGRTYKTVMRNKPAPKPDQSAFHQLTHNGITNVAGSGVVKPLVRGSLALNQGIGNAEVGLAHALGMRKDLKTQNAQQFTANSGIPKLQQFSDYQGTKRQIVGDAITNVANVAAPGSSKVVTSAVAKVVPKVIPKVIPKAVSGAAVGVPVGAVSNVGSYISSEAPLSKQGFGEAAKQGAIYGAAGGAALPIAGATIRAGVQVAAPAIQKGIQQGAQAVSNTVRSLQKQRTAQAARAIQPRSMATKHLIGEDLAGYSDLDPGRVAFYKKEILNGRPTEPILAMRKDGKLYVEDGKHRLQAKKELGQSKIDVKVVTPADLKKIDQGGYVRVPGGKGDTTKMTDISAQYKSNAKPVALPDQATQIPTDRAGVLSEPPKVPQATEVGNALPTSVAQPMQPATKLVPPQPAVTTQAVGLPPLPPAKASPSGMAEMPRDTALATIPVGNQTRYASKTVPNSEYVSDAVGQQAKKNAPLYNPETERARYTESLGKIKAQGVDNFTVDVSERLKAKNIDSQTVADTQAVAAMLDAAGDTTSLQKAADLYDALSEKLTAAGQTVQAAAILAKRTPEGLRYHAQRTLNKAGVKVTPEIQTQLKALIEAVRQTDSQTEAGKMARYRVTEFVDKKVPTKVSEKFVNFWRAGLLTAPTTTAGNLLGNASEAVIRKGFVNPVATVADQLMSLKTGKRAMTLDGGYGAGAKEGADKLQTFLKTGYDERNALSKYDAKRTNYDTKILDSYVNGVYKLMSTADQPFWYGARKEALRSIGKAEALNNGIPIKQQGKWINDFVTNPPEAALERASQDAAFATFQNKTGLGQAAVAFKDGLNKIVPGFGDFIVPFTQVPASIATRIVTRTPVGTAAEAVRQMIAVHKGSQFDQRAMAQSIGEGAFGAAVLGAGYSLANSGMMTFGFPADPRERQLWEAEGKQPYSVRVGDRWYSLNYIQPFGTILAVGAKVGEELEAGKSLPEAMATAAATAGQSVANQSFVKGVSGAIDTITDPERSATKFANQTGSSIVPNFIRSFARSIDPLQREQAGFVEGIKQGIPGLREDTAPKVDAFGQPLEAKDNPVNQYLNPLRPSIARESNPVVTEAARLQKVDSGVIPSQVNKTSLGSENELSKEQINDLEGRIGAKANEAWKQVIDSPGYAKLTDDEKAKALKNASTDIAAVVKAQYAEEKGISYKSELSKSQAAYAKGTLNFANYANSKGSVAGLPKNYDSLDDNVKSFYDSKLGATVDDEWNRSEVDDKGKDLVRRANQIRGNGMPELPASNKVASLYADFVAKRDEQKWSPVREVVEKRKLLKEAYKSSLDDNDTFLLGAGAGVFRQAYDAGEIDDDTLKRLVAYDNLQIQLGGGQQVGKKLRKLLGIAPPPNEGPYGSGSAKKVNYKSFESPMGILTKYATSGANLARTASLK